MSLHNLSVYHICRTRRSVDTTYARERWQAVAWQRGYLQASREVPEPPVPQPSLGELAASEGWLEATPKVAEQMALSQEELAALFSKQWEQGYSFRFSQEQERQTRKLPEPLGAE